LDNAFAIIKARILNDIDETEYNEIVLKYGEPTRLSFSADFLEFECELVRKSSAKGRQHDITCFIPSEEGYVTIQKPQYANTGIFRAPSGGAKSGELLEAAAIREMHEETGFQIELRHFVLDLSLDVRCSEGVIPWRSLVFLADRVGGDLDPIDKREIFDIRISTREEMIGPIATLMEGSGWGGFEYRAFLTRSFFEELDRLGLQ
jgi:ADP-ribose pyrophosphatase YjhB (NUDIX family)